MTDFKKYLPSDEKMDRARVEAALLREALGPDSDDNEPIRTLIRAAVERAVADERARHAREIEQLRRHVSLAALYLSRLTNCSKCMTKIEHPDEIYRIGNYITAALAALDGEDEK